MYIKVNRKKNISKLDTLSLIKALCNDETDISVKYLINDELKKRVITIDSDSLKDIKFKEEDLFKTYYPSALKQYILKALNINYEEVFASSNTSLQKIIIDLNDGYNLVQIIEQGLSKEIIDYIIKTKLDSKYNICEILSSYKIDIEFKEQIIQNYINKNNILYILVHLYNKELIKFILDTKDSCIKEALDDIKEIDFLEVSYPSKLNEYYLNTYQDKIIKLVDRISDDELIKLLIRIKSSIIAKFIIDRYELRIKMAIFSSKKISYLALLYNENIDYHLKEELLDKRIDEIKEELKKKDTLSLRLSYLRKREDLPPLLQKVIIDSKYNELVMELKKREVISDILYGNYCKYYLELLIKEKIDENNIMKLFNDTYGEITNEVLELCLEVLKRYINLSDITKIVTLEDIKSEDLKKRVFTLTEDIIKNRVLEMEKKERYKLLYKWNCLKDIKIFILKEAGIDKSELDLCLLLIKYNDLELVIDNYELIRLFFQDTFLKLEIFLQYGCNSNNKWLIQVIKIMRDLEKDKFFKVYKYILANFYKEDMKKENMVFFIECFLKVLNGYSYNKELLLELEEKKYPLSKEEIDNLEYLFLQDITCNDLEDVKRIRKEKLKEYENIDWIEDIEVLKYIFLDCLQGKSKIWEEIGESAGITYIMNINHEVETIQSLGEEILKFTRFIEKILDIENIDDLKKIVKYFMSNHDNLVRLQNGFKKLPEMVRLLLELDAEANLSKVKDALNLGLIDEKLSRKYGGLVLDYRNTNYCLYAHIISRHENEEDIMKGIASGRQNFISMSPISYLGQRYYYGQDKIILAYNHLPTGSFICSSMGNMSTNCWLKNNSLEVNIPDKKERSILETSSVCSDNSEVLLYREGIVPCGIILVGGRTPNEEELKLHEKYNLPFILTQEMEKVVENPRMVFKKNQISTNISHSELGEVLDYSFNITKKSDYTGRVIALFTDSHSMYEPTLAILEDIKRHGVREIYSLGDNIGLGPNPHETLSLLRDYNVLSVAGNSEYYSTLGTEPFTYFNQSKLENQAWTYDKLSVDDLRYLEKLHPSIDLNIGNKVVVLCHFANDIRWDYAGLNSTWTYQENFKEGISSKQFLYTNSKEAEELIKKHLENIPINKGYIDTYLHPLFNEKMITSYDQIIQGHVHFDMNDYLGKTQIKTLRAVAMGYKGNEKEACYYLLKEKVDGTFEIEKRLVPFNNSLLQAKILSSGIPHKDMILKYTKN